MMAGGRERNERKCHYDGIELANGVSLSSSWACHLGYLGENSRRWNDGREEAEQMYPEGIGAMVSLDDSPEILHFGCIRRMMKLRRRSWKWQWQ